MTPFTKSAPASALSLCLALPLGLLALPGSGAADPLPDRSGIRDVRERSFAALWQVGTPLDGVAAAWQAPNRARGLRTFFAEDGARVVPFARGAVRDRWEWGLDPVRFGRAGSFEDVPAGELAVVESCAEYRRGALVEWFANGPLGLQQGFTLERAPVGGDGAGPLELALAIRGPLRAELLPHGRGLVFGDPCGERVLDYGGLSAWDAAGRTLPARMRVDGRTVWIVVDDARAVYPVTIDPLITAEEAELSASDGAAGDAFGVSVSIDGDRALVGASQDDAAQGSAYVLVRSGTTWTEEAKLTASDAAIDSDFGISVSLSGDRALVGAPRANKTGTAYVFARSGTTWSEEAAFTSSDRGGSFGVSVALEGDRALVGTDRSNKAFGSATVFERSGTTWSETAVLMSDDIALDDGFGSAVSLCVDRALVGAYRASKNGAAYVFAHDGTAWSQEDRLVAGSINDFGFAVSLSSDWALIGAPRASKSSGSAYVYVRSGTAWSLHDTLFASDGTFGDRFGNSVSLDSGLALIGSHNHDAPAIDSGSAYVFERTGTTWSEEAKLVPGDAATGDVFGGSVALSCGLALVGAPNAEGAVAGSGSAYAFRLARSPTTYCSSKTNACGSGVIGSTGASSASQSSGFVVTGDAPLGGRIGVLLYNEGPGPAPPYLPFGGVGGDGRLCMGFSDLRHARGAASGGVDGQCGNGAQFAVDMNAYAAGALGGFPSPYLSTCGATVHCQWWGRESPGASYLTDGMEYVVGP